MPLETAVYLNTLDATQPVGQDALAYVHLHLQLIKKVLKDTFPNITGPVTSTQAALINPYTTGMIIQYWGLLASIPTGWHLCDGTNGTPDLRGKFVIGAGGAIASGAVGGYADATLPSHSHTATSGGQSAGHTHTAGGGTTSSAGQHRHFIAGSQGGGNYNDIDAFHTFPAYNHHGGNFEFSSSNDITAEADVGLSSWSAAHSHTFTVSISDVIGDHTHGVTVNAAGTDGTGKNLPPFVGLYFIMKT